MEMYPIHAIADPVARAVYTAPVSPAFYVALLLYLISAVLHAGVFADARPLVIRMARWTLVLAFLVHGVEIGWRGVEDVHPGTSVREALGFLSWLMVGGYLLATVRYSMQIFGAFVAPVALIILAAARLSPSGEPVPGLGLLGRIHISLATVGVAIFALATGLAVVYLMEERSLKRKRFDSFLFRRGIALETLDLLAHRLVLLGFPIFTVAIMLGAVWVSKLEATFNRPEYPLALITWVSYAGLIITRTTHGWRGRKAALLTIIGFLAAVLVLGLYFVRRALV
jgi:ABC-type uncharacterized transport system permease subunit